ncbi:DUF4914 family protein [Pseudobacteroides cellulosolvens]|uniref:DUF4914 domain-containing protein n=1 Tax=Pseudobacteroides cellulosolvens ATCC 35603 = DSM 2933 TaxID=398512 RepID=A0A0L6JUP1_9FIRM|nr:DUF4914 family protein [Pseudobacteroides cellulosolvens]KNY29365.1 hypothetical protein Bccel_4639 [Pseudobacteroides cellulosolvens ATCC 35603 = DSM 2933]
MNNKFLERIVLPYDLQQVIDCGVKTIIPENRSHLLSLAIGDEGNMTFEVEYDVPEQGNIVEATVVRCKNGAAVNYMDMYMRRRDPDCMVVADNGETDKPRYRDVYGEDFMPLRGLTFEWLKNQELIIMPFMAGGAEFGYPALLVAPANAGFFAAGLADLQGFIPKNQIPEGFKPKAVIYLAPPYRHTHFEGKQVVVHNRLDDMHELFSYNLYPGPSAKKGIYGVLLHIGELEGWVTVHASTVRVITPYENIITIMHEGASGGGKSEMLEQIHKELDGRIILAQNTITKEKTYLELKETCQLQPVTDDMALCHPAIQNGSRKLTVKDAEIGWFLRINHINKYGTDPHYEKLCIHPQEPLIFLNIHGIPGSTCLIWEHTMDEPGKPCPNPRVIMPRRFIPDIVDEPVEIDVRSFGVRTPPCTKEKPSYGIMGVFHILPPSLAWLWRLVAPRGHDNPSITDSEGMSSEGVGSYWPFATGKMVDQANLLLDQIISASATRYIIIPNQHIGAYKVGFMPQWVAREYLARRGTAKFRADQLVESRCSLMGYSLETLKVDGTFLAKGFLQPNLQPEIGNKGYDEGAKILTTFFKKELEKFLTPDLNPLGREIIECCMNDGKLEEYIDLIPIRM